MEEMDSTETPAKKISFHYIKTNDFKTSMTTGVYGGVTLQGLINISFYLDRAVIPRRIEQEVVGNKLSAGILKEGREGAVREVHSGIIIDTETAKHIIKWLTEKIDFVEKNTIKT